MSYSLAQLNAMGRDEFVKAFGAIYEHSPWVAEQAAALRPFASLDDMLAAMQAAVDRAPRETKLALIRAHPELQGKPAVALTTDSKMEQRSAGLDQCSPQQLQQLESLNQAYRKKFDFPFVIAVRGLSRGDIIASLSQRLSNEHAVEFDTCLAQIARIAGLRLAALVR